MPKIFILVGPISSSKSTYCKNAAKKGFIILNDDAIVNMLHGGNYILYDENLKLLYKSIENTIISTSLALKRDIIIDRGLNISKNSRKRYISLAKSFDVEIEAIVFKREKPEIHARRRFESDNRGLSYESWLNIAIIHDKQWEEPDKSEGFDKIHYISYEEIKEGLVL